MFDSWLAWVAVASVVTFIATLIIVPVLLVRLPPDYFVEEERQNMPLGIKQPAVRTMLIIAKNILGVVLTLGGIAMLVMPGQGILSILIGISLIDFPGKFKLERKLVCRGPVHRSINWIRTKAGREPIIVPGGEECG